MIADEERWAAYIRDSLIETTVSRDVLLLSRIEKPALLRQLFELGCAYSGQELSYQKMLGQLQDAGNTTTLAHYLELLSGAGLVTGLQKHSSAVVRARGSSPKLLALNTALVSALAGTHMDEVREQPRRWGHLIETAVGAHLAAGIAGSSATLGYWRDRGHEVDFTLQRGERLTAIEVKSGDRRDALSGLAAFKSQHPDARPLLVGADGIPLDEFLLTPPATWV